MAEWSGEYISPYAEHGKKSEQVKKITVSIPLKVLKILTDERTRRQVNNLRHATNSELLEWLSGGDFEKNPIGVEFDPTVLERLLAAGVPARELARRGSAPPDGRRARSGLRTLRWKTL